MVTRGNINPLGSVWGPMLNVDVVLSTAGGTASMTWSVLDLTIAHTGVLLTLSKLSVKQDNISYTDCVEHV